MIIVMGEIKLASGGGERARTLLADHAAVCTAEEGCESYAFSIDCGDPDLVRIAERWASAEALAAHGAAPHQKAFGRALRDHPIERMSVKAWDGTFWRTLVGD
ncbi:putative quinol monooxygenase [Sphingomonas sp.]|jgi:quinol monooxygenase YgiN|uniref:putative quinol monooxygenase n=1 Tax=Sphingomonas sp. TaxID=28214 RepID=UPI002ED9F6CD